MSRVRVFACFLVGVVVAAISPPRATAADGSRVEVRVDRRVELLSIVARLARFGEYRQPNAESPYSKEVDEHFELWIDHPVFARLKRLRAEHGVSYDAVMSLAVHLTDDDRLAERTPFDPRPERLDARWPLAETRAFLEELRDFAATSDAFAFFESHAPLYRETEARMRALVEKSKALPWFDAFFGARAEARYAAIPGLLCGGGSFGVGVRYPADDPEKRPEEILPIFGCYTFDEQGIPTFTADLMSLLIHELCHTYSNPIVDRYADAFEPAASRLFPRVATVMSQQAYGTWLIMIYESLVRACTVRCRLATEGRDAARQQAQYEVSRGFEWVPDLAESFADYEADRKLWPTFEDYMPEVVLFFEKWVERVEAESVGDPHIVVMIPANDATDVNPALTTLMIQFDRPMALGWSFMGDKKDMPEFVGQPSFDGSGTVLTATIKLQPGRTYRYGLNGPRNQGFKSREGKGLVPVRVEFTTSKQ